MSIGESDIVLDSLFEYLAGEIAGREEGVLVLGPGGFESLLITAGDASTRLKGGG